MLEIYYDVGEGGGYEIFVESGSHCAMGDTPQSFWMWVSWFLFLEEITSYGIEFKCRIFEDNEERSFSMHGALREIVKGSELGKYIKLRDLNSSETEK